MEGQRLGSYVLQKKLGEGGMGVVYVAVHQQLGQQVAVKLLLPEVSKNPEMLARFVNEARAASLINHPSIVRVLDFGETGDGSAYFVMELLAGESLAARLRRGPPAIAKACLICRQVANALAVAHQAGIVHRDLKPDNIFLVPDPEVGGGERAKILDFGIAKLTADNVSANKTRTGVLMGTPYYMSPEQARGARDVDGRSDIYAVGCILYELLTGRPPFAGEGPGEVLGQHLFVEPTPVRRLAPAVPPDLEAVVMRALVKDPAARYQTMTELAAALQPFALPSAVSVPSSVALPPGVTPAPTLKVRRGGARALWIGAAGLAVVGGVVIVAVVSSSSGGHVVADAGRVAVAVARPPDATPAVAVATRPDAAVVAVVAPPDAAPHVVAAAGTEPAPWAAAKLPASAAPVTVGEWKRADNRATCAALAFADAGPDVAAAHPRHATFMGGWAVAWDGKGLPGTDSSGASCATCGRSVYGVAGAGVEAAGTSFDLFESHIHFADGGEAGYGPQKYASGKNSYLAYVVIPQQGCLYNVWTELGPAHMELLLRSLRYVERAP